MRHEFHTLDVFTARRFAGNPLAVVLAADDLDGARMQIVAREFNFSETIFVLAPDDPAHTAKVRIFTPTHEMPFAGHPTIGCAVFLAAQMHDGDGDFDTVVTLEEPAGLVPVTVTRRGGVPSAMFTAPVIPHPTDGATPNREAAARAIGVQADDIGFKGHEIGVFAGGPGFLYIPVASREALAASRPNGPGWPEMIAAAGVNSAYLYTQGGDGANYRARMYARATATYEDPATGSATAILAAQILSSGALSDGTNKFTLQQGYDMGRPSDLALEVDVAAGAIAVVRVGGGAVHVAHGWIETG